MISLLPVVVLLFVWDGPLPVPATASVRAVHRATELMASPRLLAIDIKRVGAASLAPFSTPIAARQRGSRAKRGALFGALVGGGIGAGMGAAYCGSDCGGGPAHGALVFGAIGAGIGTAVGALWAAYWP